MTPPGIRLFLAVNALGIAAAAVVFLLAAGLPLAATGGLDAPRLALLALAAGAVVLVTGALLLARVVARPVDRLLRAAARLDPAHQADLPLLGDAEGPALSRAALAFERVAAALEEERARLAAKVDELTRANVALADARESLLRTEKLATVGRLASGVAHEVGNPLGAITGYVELARLRAGADAHPELADALTRIDLAAQRIDAIVRGLLDFARPSAPALAPVGLAPAVDGALRLARVQSRFKGVSVELDLPDDLPPVLADEHLLAQVLLNLFLNAGDAMEGAGTLRVGARAEAGVVRVAVADEGPGIAEADRSRIFEPFFTTKEPGRGTGLGLAISHRILETLGGEIAVGPAPSGGALFTLRLKAARS